MEGEVFDIHIYVFESQINFICLAQVHKTNLPQRTSSRIHPLHQPINPFLWVTFRGNWAVAVPHLTPHSRLRRDLDLPTLTFLPLHNELPI